MLQDPIVHGQPWQEALNAARTPLCLHAPCS